MTETVAYIRNSIKDIYPPGEAQALVRLIMERVCGLSTHQLLLGKGKELSDTEKFKIKEIVEGLRLYKPIQYLLGIADFYGMEFKVTPDVLIPRPETAELVERIITDYQGQAPRILDIGTGSGCIAISLAKHLPEAEVAAVDISPEALAVAEENARGNQRQNHCRTPAKTREEIQKRLTDRFENPLALTCIGLCMHSPALLRLRAQKHRDDAHQHTRGHHKIR